MLKLRWLIIIILMVVLLGQPYQCWQLIHLALKRTRRPPGNI